MPIEIQKRPMGAYQTNCYIVHIDGEDFIVDPGVGATAWVKANVKNPVAILNTHGHFDHVWSNAELQRDLDIPIYCPEGDCFLLENDPFSQGTPPSRCDVAVKPDETVTIGAATMTFLHFPGHTPGCSAIEIRDHWFCGDFLFRGSIGRVDFPYSDPAAMRASLQKAMEYPGNVILHPGHGPDTTLEEEKRNIPYWIKALNG
jgi:hydroxyacylglutathione hydrolase